MKILITGANGQVGRALQEQLRAAQLEYLAADRARLDIGERDAVAQLMNEYQPDLVINAAAYTAVDKAESDLENAYRINRDGPAHLAQSCAQLGIPLFHISTDYVFPGTADRPYHEDDPTQPQSVYGASKLAGEEAVASQNPRHIILRTAWVFGEHGNNFVKTMLRLGQARDSLGVVADQEGGPTYAGDIASALITMAQQYWQNSDLPWGVYHFSGLPHTNWCEFAREIFSAAESAQLLGKAAPQVNAITTADYPTPAKRPANSRLDCQKIHATFGIAASDWRQAIKNIHHYHQS